MGDDEEQPDRGSQAGDIQEGSDEPSDPGKHDTKDLSEANDPGKAETFTQREPRRERDED